jgi:hypothetical protein
LNTASVGIVLGLFLAGLSQGAQAQEYRMPNASYCHIQLESGQVVDLTYMCGARSADLYAQRPSFGSLAQRSLRPSLQVSNVKVTQSLVSELIRITGSVVNLTSTNQKAGSFKYQLRNNQNNRVVGISRAFVYKDIPPGGQVSFEAFIKKADSGYTEPTRLQFQFLAFD